jgi:hypothetical protein
MFVTANEGFAEELASALKERNITADMISSLSDPLGRFDFEVDMSRIFIVDDHVEVMCPIHTHKAIAPVLSTIYECPDMFSIQTSHSKSCILLNLPGRGARKRLKAAGHDVVVPQ